MAQPKDALGERMKSQYEVRSQIDLPRRTYVVIRLDGKAFHSYTRGLNRPYDLPLMDDMDLTAKFLCENVQGCKLAYVQSDEISLVLTDFETITTQAWFDSNVQKMVSISASMATAKFNQLRQARINDHYEALYQMACQEDVISYYRAKGCSWEEIDAYRKSAEHKGLRNRSHDVAEHAIEKNKLAFFDSRAFCIPDPTEVENYLIWRQQDATRNSIQMAAQSFFSQKALHGKNTSVLQEMMWAEKGVNWNDYPDGFKRGRCIVRETYKIGLEELQKTGDSAKLRMVEQATVVDARTGEPVVDIDKFTTRHRWIVEAPPVFTKDRDYFQSRIPKL